jgi:predicted dinucleotide-binding enzyme
MRTKRTIALVGAASLTQALAFALVRGNNRVLLFSKLYDDAKLITTSIKNKNAFADIEAMPCSYTASWETDIIITAIPLSELKEFFLYIKDVSVQKVLVVGEHVNEFNANFLNDVDEAQKNFAFHKNY